MKKHTSILAAALLFTSVSCTNTDTQKAPVAPSKPQNEHMVMSVLWQQNAAEYRALSYQAFNIASLRIQALEAIGEKPLAVITDIDETVLDNSPYSGMQIHEDKAFDKQDWIAWGKLEQAEAVPGAVDFFNLADSLGIEVFYISNRYEVQLEETIANLAQLDLPNADAEHVFLKTDTSEKQARRDRVLENHEVVMYLGDNLTDFTAVFDNQRTPKRNALVDDMQASFGDKFIVLPNPMYGDWESRGIYEGNRDWTAAQRDSIRLAKVASYQ